MAFIVSTRDVESGVKTSPKSAKRYLMAILPAAMLLLANVLSFGATTPTLNDPFGVTVDGQGRVYVANVLGGVTIYNTSLRLIGTISDGVNQPMGVAVASDGRIYVANNSGNNITVYAPNRTQLSPITDSSLQHPTGLFVDGCHDIWVLDQAGMLHLYLDNGFPLSTASVYGASAFGPWDGYVSVWGIPDSNGGYDTKIQNMGEAVHTGLLFTGVLNPVAPAAVGGIAQDALGRAFVTIPGSNEVQIWTLNGVATHAVTTASLPLGIAVDPINRRFYVTEPGANQVEVFFDSSAVQTNRDHQVGWEAVAVVRPAPEEISPAAPARLGVLR